MVAVRGSATVTVRATPAVTAHPVTATVRRRGVAAVMPKQARARAARASRAPTMTRLQRPPRTSDEARSLM